MEQKEIIEILQEENLLLKKRNAAIRKNNRTWKRKVEKLRKEKRELAVLLAGGASEANKEAGARKESEGHMNYYISDLHLCCRSQTQEGINYDNRPFVNVVEMHEYTLQHWNQKVTNGDTVYILGDVALRGKNDDLVSLVARLNGKKVLVIGNHDDLADYRYRVLFHDVCHYKELSENVDGKAYKLVLCHYPILMWNGQHRGAILLYGHTHNSREEEFFQDCIVRMNESEELTIRRNGDQNIYAINVGAMHPWMNYEPRTLKELLSRKEIQL